MVKHYDIVLLSQLAKWEIDLLAKQPDQLTDEERVLCQELRNKLAAGRPERKNHRVGRCEDQTQKITQIQLETANRFLKSQVNELLCLLGRCHGYGDAVYNTALLDLADIADFGYDVHHDSPLSGDYFSLTTLPIRPDLLHNLTFVDPEHDIVKQPVSIPSSPLNSTRDAGQLLQLSELPESVDKNMSTVSPTNVSLLQPKTNSSLIPRRNLKEDADTLEESTDQQYYIGMMHHDGEWGARDYILAVEYLTEAADRGHARAQYQLGSMYRDGRGAPQDTAKAVRWFTQAAEEGHVGVGDAYCVGNAYIDGDGHPDAQYNLGLLYSNGVGVTRDLTQAFEWYLKAAKHNVDAQIKLGSIYRNGIGVSRDLTKAVEWYTKAADQGNACAQYQLGYVYSYGEGVERDDTKAAEWYTKAVDVYTKAAEQGDADAQWNLGNAYFNALGVAQDISKAFELYSKAAEQGNACAQHKLGDMYRYGQGVDKDLAKAVVLITKAAEQGDVNAQLTLSFMYHQGESVTQDLTKSNEWHSKTVQKCNGLSIPSGSLSFPLGSFCNIQQEEEEEEEK